MKKFYLFGILFTIFLFSPSVILESSQLSQFEDVVEDPHQVNVPDGYYKDDADFLTLTKVYYFGNDDKFNAILKVLSSFDENTKFDEVSYGVMIYADANYDTGMGGYDYRYQVIWNDGKWTEIYEKLPSWQDTSIVFENNTISNVFDNEEKYVLLNVDLEKIDDPENFAAVFFTQAVSDIESQRIQDFTVPVLVPTPQIDVSTIPSLLQFEAGTENVFYIKIDSNIKENPEINYRLNNLSDEIIIEDLLGGKVILTNGVAEIPVKITLDPSEHLNYYSFDFTIHPWHDNNPHMKNIDAIKDEIIKNSFYRIQSEPKIYPLSLVNGITPPITLSTWTQIGLVIGTMAMVGITLWNVKRTKDFADRDLKLLHSKELKKAFDRLQDIVCRKNYHDKTLEIQIAYDESKAIAARFGSLDLKELQNMTYVKLTTNIVESYEMAIEHLNHRKYRSANNSWKNIQKFKTEYDETVEEINNKIQSFLIETLKEFPDFIEFNGSSNNAYYTDSIVHTVFRIGERISETDDPPNLILNYVLYDKENVTFIQKEGRTLFQFKKEEVFDESKIQDLFSKCIKDSTIKESLSKLDDIHSKSGNEITKFNNEIKKIIQTLKHGVIIKGKCELGY